ncbi:hypothetical protein V6N13_044307 [Hibiscus sabdariffa]
MSHNSDDENSQSSTFIKRTETNEIGLKGLVVNSEDAAYNLYNDYGHDLGFSVRKGKNRYVFGTKIIRSKDFYCSKQGFKELEDDEGTKKHNKLETRTGCPAMIRFTVQDNQWTVSHFISEHNHELATPSKRHLLRSARSIPTAKANTIDSMVSAGIRPTDVYTYMSNEVRGVENVGFTRRDCYNYVNKHKMMMIEAGDGQSLLNHFKEIPERYILQRWTKDAKKNMHGGNVAELSQWCSKEVEIVFRNRMIRFAYNLITKSQENENTRQLCQKILYEGDMKIEKELAKLCVAKNHELKENETNSKGVRSKNVRRSLIEEISSEDGVILKDCENKSSPILNPPCVRPKGISNARLKGHLERRKPKVSKLPKPKKRKQSTIEEHSNAPTGSIQSSGNFAIPLVMMPPNNIYTSSYNSVQQRIDTPTPTPTSYQELLARIQGHPNFIL